MHTHNRIRFLLPIIGIIALLDTSNAFAHGGGLDRFGCHTETATGEYHCHNGGRDSDPENAPPDPATYHGFNLFIFTGGTLASIFAIDEDDRWLVSLGVVGHVFGLATSHLRVPETERKYAVDLGTPRSVYFALNAAGLIFDAIVLSGLFDNPDPNADDDISLKLEVTLSPLESRLNATLTF